jgi:hypothetical protein
MLLNPRSIIVFLLVCLMVFSATFNNVLAVSFIGGENRRTRKKPTTCRKYHSKGCRKLTILHARLRHQCSSLNVDLFLINITNDQTCQCGAPFEDSVYYLMNKTKDIVFFRNLRGIHKNIETLLFGNDGININENSMIFSILDKQKILISGLSSGLH